MKTYPLGEQTVSGTYGRVMDRDEYRNLKINGILGFGREDYIPTFPITDISVLGRTPKEIKEKARKIGVSHPEVLAIFFVKDAKAVYGPRQSIGGREIKLKAGTPAKLLVNTNCR